jgi:uncharacterized protein with NRDE domain
MCIVFFEWTTDNRFIVCHNRDEILSRKTIKTSWWENNTNKKNENNNSHEENDDDDDSSKNNNTNFEILAPRDMISGGSWFGFEKTTGRCAFLTNIREKDNNNDNDDVDADADDSDSDSDIVDNSTTFQKLTSRGELVINYLTSDPTISAIDYLKTEFCSLSSKSSSDNNDNNNNSKLYAGFNLILFSGQDLAYYSNRLPKQQQQQQQQQHDNNPISLSMGVSYGLSNSILDRPFVKVSKGLMIFRQIILSCKDEKKAQNKKDNKNNQHEEEEQQLIMLEGLKCLMQRKQQYYDRDEDLPITGYPIEFERNCSSIYVPIVNDYGTRTTIRFILEQQQELDDKGRLRRRQKIRLIETDLNPTTLQWEETTIAATTV